MIDPILESIAKLTTIGTVMFLPKEPISNYAQVKRVLQKAGGTYKKNTFVFDEQAKDVMARLLGGEKIDDKKKFQQFFTPAALAEEIVRNLQIEDDHICLEPSAGYGVFVVELLRYSDIVDVVELDPKNCKILKSFGDRIAMFEGDFLTIPDDLVYDRIVANPPFTNNQDIDHVRKMYQVLKYGGCMSSIMGTSWKKGSQKKQVLFREWLDERNADVVDIPAAVFKESGTKIATCRITIHK